MKRLKVSILFIAILSAFAIVLTGCGGGGGGSSSSDVTPPTVSSTSPVNNATDVAVNIAITATFSETMTASTVTTATFTLSGGVTGTVTYSGTTATFTPSGNLAYSTPYTATITTGVKDAAGNAMASPYTWTFTTGTSKVLVLARNTSSLDSEETKVTNFLTQNGYQYDLADSSTITGGLNVSSYKVIYFRTGSEPTGYNSTSVLTPIQNAVEGGSSLVVEYYGSYLAQYLGWGSITSPGWYPVVYDKLAYVKSITSHEIFNGISTWDPPSSPDKTEQLIWSLNNPGSYTCKNLSITGEQKIEFWHLLITYGWNGQSTSSSYCQSWGGCTSERSIHSDSIRYATHGLGKLIQPPAVGIGGQSNGNSPVTLGQAGTSLMKNLLNWAQK